MDQDPEFYVSPEDLEAQMTAEERGEGKTTQKLATVTSFPSSCHDGRLLCGYLKMTFK